MSPVLWIAVVVVVVAIVAVFVWRGRGSTPSVTAPRPAPATIASGGGFGSTGLGARVRSLFGSANGDAWAQLEDLLLKADVGPRATADLTSRIRARFTPDADPADLLRTEVLAILGPSRPVDLDGADLDVILVVGVNGS